MKRKKHRIIFLNQMAGPLFRELVEDLSRMWPPCLLLTGHKDTIGRLDTARLDIIKAPEYNRKSILTRLLSWVRYFFSAFFLISRQSPKSLVFIVSNPPFLGLAGLFFKLMRGQPYIILIYDVYPDLLVNIGVLRVRCIAKMWDIINRLVYRYCLLVFTIGNDMGKKIRAKMGTSTQARKKIICIPPWVDTTNIQPIPKHRNHFSIEHDLQKETVVLYSGNMGYAHDIETMLGAARLLSNEKAVIFLFIGEGAKKRLVEQEIKNKKLKNVLLLSFQHEHMLPFSMAAGDIGIVAYTKGTEGCMIPSKTFYYMAAGVVPIVLSKNETDLTKMVESKNCGIWVRSGDIYDLTMNIKRLHQEPEMMERLKMSARKVAESDYSRENTKQYAVILKKHFSEELGPERKCLVT